MIQAEQILRRMNPNQRINYDYVLLKMIEKWRQENIRPKILIHSCCGPCSSYVLEFLTGYAEITVYYVNSNIHPRVEYERRKRVQQKFITDFNRTSGKNVCFLAAPYRPLDYFTQTKGLESEPEGGKRCSVCFDMRLDAAAKKAKELHCDYFGSTLTISPHKNSRVINQIGLKLEKTEQIAYLPSDFKKRGGYQRSVVMCREYNIYRQCYCGCIFAAMQQGVNLAEVVREAKRAIVLEEMKKKICWNGADLQKVDE